jgi:hypothetical protein
VGFLRHDWELVGGANGTRHYRCVRCRQDRLCGKGKAQLPMGPCAGAPPPRPQPVPKGKPSVA